MKKLILLIALSLFVNAANKAVSPYNDVEQKLKTSGKLRKFHAVVHFPYEIKLNYPGYIVGIEKSPRKRIIKDKLKLLSKNRDRGVRKVLTRVKTDPKLLYISHIFAYNDNSVEQIYNLYTKDKNNINDAYNKSWSALNRLKEKVLKDKDSYNVIVVFVMGWNTSQEEAIRNFNSFYRNIKEASKNKFKPLFIGVTWPSEWESSLLPDAIVKAASFPGKAGDADELGITWLGALLHNTLKDINKPIIVVGHSFGARATAMATFNGNAIYNKSPFPLRKIDYLIGLQGAYSLNRYLHKGTESIYFDIKKSDTKIILTASKYDTANTKTIIWNTPYAGSYRSYKKYCTNKYSDIFDCIVYNNQDINSKLKIKHKILYLDASSIIKYNIYNSGGGAHSDVYNSYIGKLLWQVIKNSI